MNTVNKQTAFELKEAGFPQPIPAFGQVWWHMDGSLHVVMRKGEFHTITRYIQDDRVCAGFFNDEALAEMAFAPNAVDILAEMPSGDAILKVSSSLYECSCFSNSKSFIMFGESPHEAMASRYLAINNAERV